MKLHLVLLSLCLVAIGRDAWAVEGRASKDAHPTYEAAVKAIGGQPLPTALKTKILQRLSLVHDGMRKEKLDPNQDHYDSAHKPNKLLQRTAGHRFFLLLGRRFPPPLSNAFGEGGCGCLRCDG